MARLSRRLSAAAITLLFSSAASATVRPPIQVRLADQSIAIVKGQPFSNVLEIRGGFPLAVGDVTLEGAQWSVDVQLHKAQLSAAVGEVVRIPFTATPESDEEPLQFSFDYGGGVYTTQLNVAPRDYRRATAPSSTQLVNVADAIRPAEPLVSPGPLATDLEIEMGDPGSNKAGRWVRVRGRFGSYLPDPAGEFRGTDSAAVYVMDQRFPADALLASGGTDAWGYFDLNFWWDPCGFLCDNSLDIYVKFELGNAEATVRNTLFAGIYAWSTGATVNYQGSDLDIGTHAPGNPAEYAAPHFLTAMVRTWRWFFYKGYNPEQVTGYWPETQGAWYQPPIWPLGGEIHLGADRQWEDAIISHEWGHHWVTTYGLSPAPSYCNSMCDDDGCGHCLWCAETTEVAFTEGAPDWIGDVVSREYPSVYGGSISGEPLDVELSDNCQMDGTFHDPLYTEGYFAALLRDMEDSTQDDDPHFALGTDKMSGLTSAILYTIDNGSPTNPTAFLDSYRSYYGTNLENLWFTAKNCGYEIDVTPPGTVGALSSSHAISVGQMDNSVDFSWIRANDDASGTSGYSIELSVSPAFPDDGMEIGNVTSYTSPPLPPGSFYFRIRAVDNSGKWSNSDVSYGPFVILAPPPVGPNLSFMPGDGSWAHALVPRPDMAATEFSVPAPLILAGDNCALWWSARYTNSGNQLFPQSTRLDFYFDENWQEELTIFDPGFAQGAALNRGPFCATGGRHTLGVRLDLLNEVSELSEFDNWWGRQWVFLPSLLQPDVELIRAAPPQLDALQFAIVDGSPIFDNVDGVRVAGTSWWTAVVLHAGGPMDDYDLTLHAPTASPNAGFDVASAGSYRIEGQTDAVIINHNASGWGSTWDVGVHNYNYGLGDYAIEHVTEQVLPFDTITNGDLAAGQLLRLWEIYLDPTAMGQHLTLRVRKTSGPGQAPLDFFWLDSGWSASAPNGGASGFTEIDGTGFLELDIVNPGYYAAVIRRDPAFADFAESVEISVILSPPDFQPGWEVSWWSPLVPSPFFDGTPSVAGAPAVLYGDVASTFLNIDAANWGWGTAGSMRSDIDLDGIWTWWLAYGTFPGGGTTAPFNWDVPWTIRAGRHTLVLRTDGPDEWQENLEANNHFGEQWIWQPQVMAYNVPLYRPAPPEPLGGWSHITSGTIAYFNTDAVRTPGPAIVGSDGYWTVVAAMPGTNSDVDLSLHGMVPSPKNGLDDYLAESHWGIGQSDFVIRNYNLAIGFPFDVAVERFYNGENYSVETDNSVYLDATAGTAQGPFAMDSGEIVDLYEVYLDLGSHQIALYPLDGLIDWGLSVHPATMPHLGKSDFLPEGLSNQNGVGQWEHVTVDVISPGYHAIAVWKADAGSLIESGSYQLTMLGGTTGVADGETPQRTQIASIQPNPFNPRTTITFDVSKAGAVALQIFDLRGRLLRHVVWEELAAGRHERTWDGTDERGHGVASGVYLVQLESAGTLERRKIVLVK
jgi:hypothetical protein